MLGKLFQHRLNPLEKERYNPVPLASRSVGPRSLAMLSNRLAFAALGMACIGAAAGGGYLATRQKHRAHAGLSAGSARGPGLRSRARRRAGGRRRGCRARRAVENRPGQDGRVEDERRAGRLNKPAPPRRARPLRPRRSPRVRNRHRRRPAARRRSRPPRRLPAPSRARRPRRAPKSAPRRNRPARPSRRHAPSPSWSSPRTR